MEVALQKQTPPLGNQGETGSLHMCLNSLHTCLKWPGSIVRDAGWFRTSFGSHSLTSLNWLEERQRRASCENDATRFEREPKAWLEWRVAGPDRVAGGLLDPHRCRPAGDDDVAVAEPAERHRRHPSRRGRAAPQSDCP